MNEEIATRPRAVTPEPARERTAPAGGGTGVDRGSLSFAQQRLWFMAQTEGGSRAYHIASALRLCGCLDAAALRRALDRIVARHESLRTTFPIVGEEPVQRVAAEGDARFALAEHDWRGRADAEAALARLLEEEPARPFDLVAGPLVRGQLVRIAEAEHALLITMHHIVSDGWSKGVLIHEFCTLYAAFREGRADPLPPLALQYPGYATWQRRTIEGRKLRQQIDFWREALAGAPALLELPGDRARPARQEHAGGFVPIELDVSLCERLRALGRRHGATLYMVLLAAWAALLSRLSGSDDIVVGTPVTHRDRTELQGMIGLFVNTLALRLDLSGAPSVARLVRQAKTRALAAFQHQDLPFEQVVELVKAVRSPSHSPVFQAMFEWHSIPDDALVLPGLEVAQLGAGSVAHASKFDLTLSLYEGGERISGGIEYATALFDADTVARFRDHFGVLLDAMADADDAQVQRLPLQRAAQRNRLLDEFARQREFAPAAIGIHDLVERQAARTPDAVAIEFADVQVTYAALNAHANRLAHRLRALGVGLDARVAVCVERDIEMVVALLAVLKAGGAYVPLDPAYPGERRRFMLEDAGARVLVTQAQFAAAFAGVDAATLVLDDPGERAACARLSAANPAAVGGDTPHRLAYLIYTSGSTGRPKGVMIEHAGVVSLFQALQDEPGFGAQDALLAVTTFAFDIAVVEIFLPLSTGARLVLMSREDSVDGSRLAAALEGGITYMQATPATWRLLLEAGWRDGCNLTIVSTGEALPAALAGELLSTGAALWNLYGPTETTIWSTGTRVSEARGALSIGRPCANTQTYLVDACGEPVPAGIAGELFIGGVGLARGYAGRAALTAERFPPNPFTASAGERLYRTGDRARFRANGDIEYLGRNDSQVKLRGFRIELQEIEAQLARHPALREVAVVVRTEPTGDKRLVAYYTAAQDDAPDADALRAFLAQTLPDYMLPSAYAPLAAMPLTASGKLNRLALPDPGQSAYATPEYEPPRGWIETVLAACWAETLQLGRIGRRDDFFALGGHSLLAMRMVSHARKRLNLEFSIADVFDRPVLADLAQALEGAAHPLVAPIVAVPRNGPAPMSFAQRRLWPLVQMQGVDRAFHMGSGLVLEGALDTDALRIAFNGLLARHEALRTTFGMEGDDPVQRFLPPEDEAFVLLAHDIRASADPQAELVRIAIEEAGAQFDLGEGPLIRGRIVQLADDRHVLLVTMHHMISDGWSERVIRNEMNALYLAAVRGETARLPALPVQYADYAHWQRRWIEGELLAQHDAYWRKTLAGAPELLELPLDRSRPLAQSYAGGFVGVDIEPALAVAVKALALRHRSTLFMTLLAAWGALLGRLARQQDVVVGVPIADRGHAELEDLVGFFVDTIPLRLDLSARPTVAELIEQARGKMLGAQQHRFLSDAVINELRPRRSVNFNPIFQAMFAWQDGPQLHAAGESGRIELSALTFGEGAVWSKLDVTLSLQESGGRIVGGIEYAAALFDAPTIRRFAACFVDLLAAMVENEGARVDMLPIVSAAERRMMLHDWNATDTAWPAGECVHEIFQAQAAKTPDAIALSLDDEELSYAELNAKSNQLARTLRELGVGPEASVAICMERSLEMIVAMLAVLKAGGAYIPLDPANPVERLRFIVEDAKPAVLLAQQDLDGLFIGGDARVPIVPLNQTPPPWRGRTRGNLDARRIGLSARNAAYVIYTSGSTGNPKGAVVEHRSLCSHMRWMMSVYPLRADGAALQKTPFSFDTSVGEILLPLLLGARLVLARPDAQRDPRYIEQLVREHRVQILEFVPSALQMFLEHVDGTSMPLLRDVVTGGEALPPAIVRRFRETLPHATLYNSYGPTEATIDVTRWDCPADFDGRVPIGRPIANAELYVLDANLESVPVGVIGELYIGGAQVARGYLNRAALTAEKFIAHPQAKAAGARLYRTGDLVRWLADGNLEFAGRDDFQVKIRGFRIELGEIEARLLEHPALREATVIAREDKPGQKRLVAYYAVAEDYGDVGAKQLQAHLAAALPRHMVPAVYVRLDALPLLPSGKLDRRALPLPEVDAFAGAQYEAPQGRIETALAEIWSDVLQIERVGRQDDFFEMGGDSLLVVRVVVRLQQTLGFDVKIDDVFARPVLAELAESLQKDEREVAQAAPPAKRRRAQVTLSAPVVMATSADGRAVASRDGGATWYDAETGARADAPAA